ncbi:MAG TPA: dienelactone hydrolase family protein [Bacteroidota bacterium]|nr:dienelactone hydrolase family protein [Bacteroidota bacterium]
MRLRLVALFLFSAVIAKAEVIGKPVEYAANGVTLKGYIAYDNAIQGKRPGILVVHEWWGNNDYSRKRAYMLAALGYVGFALDMYGDGKVADNPQDAGKMAGESMKDPGAMKARFMAALNLLKKSEEVDSTRIAAIGYCYGGGVVLNMACAGVDLQGVVSFHGSLSAVAPPKIGGVKAPILVCNGAADKFNAGETVKAFRAEMDSAKAEYQFIDYPDAMHAFTNPASTGVGEKFHIPIAYNEKADKKSWEDMQKFFATIFKK